MEDLADPKFIGHHNTNYYCFTFCLEEFLDIFDNYDSESWSADLLLFEFISTIKIASDTENERKEILQSYSPVLSWLINTRNNKISIFLFHYKISLKTKS